MSPSVRSTGAGATSRTKDKGSQQQNRNTNNKDNDRNKNQINKTTETTNKPTTDKTKISKGRQTTINFQKQHDTNNKCGPFGDCITAKNVKTLRILHQNVNGISSRNELIEMEKLIDCANEMQSDILSVVEPNLNFTKQSIKEMMRKRIKSTWPQNHSVISQIPTNRTENHQMGGSILITHGKWCSRIVSSHKDKMGRWSSITLQGRQNSQLVVISAYRPCHMSTNGSRYKTIYMQQWEYMLRESGNQESRNPRDASIQDLREYIKTIQQQWKEKNEQQGQRGIILTWDANEALSQQGQQQFMQETNMVEIFDVKYDHSTVPSTYSRGTQKIDHIMITPNIIPFVDSCGMTAFGCGYKSDHRALFLDIEIEKFLMGDAVYITPPLLRNIHTKDPRIVINYIDKVHRYLAQHNYEERLNKLVSTQKGDYNDEDHILLEQLDKDMIRARQHASKKIGKRFQAGWSPELRNAFLQLNYWKTLLSAKKHPEKSYEKAIKEMETKLEITPIPLQEQSEKRLRNQIKLSAIKFNEALTNAHENRQKHLTQRAEALANSNNSSAASEVKKLMAVEQTIDTFRKIRNVFKKNQKSGLSYVLHPKTDETGTIATDQCGNIIYETTHDLEEIETLLVQRNIEHFGQAHGSPPTEEFIATLLGDGCTTYCQQVTGGSADTTMIPQKGLKNLLEHLLRKSQRDIDISITSDDLYQGFKNWRESTTTSPSGIDLGHWRSTTYPIKSNDDHNRKSTEILKWHAILINETVKREYVLNRWKTVHSCMIEKTPGYPLITKLRVIHIFEADLNLLLGIWSRRLQKHAETNNFLHPDQWAQSGNRAIDTAMTKKLTYIYSTMTRTDLGTLDTDAKSCYDRMIASIVALRNIQLGMPKLAAKLQSSFLNNARFHLRTKLGTSLQSYGNTQITPQYGQGQGAKWAPMSWIGISTLLLDIISETSPYNVTITNTLKRVIDCRQLDGYVDDFTSWVNLAEQLEDDPHAINQSANEIHKRLQHLNQEWEHLLACTGGRLELPKCFNYVINWRFDVNGRPSLDDENKSQITLTDSYDGNTITIDRKTPNTPHRTLGAYISPTENNISAIQELANKCNKFSTLLRASGSNLSRTNLNIFMSSLYKPSITYMLPTTSLDEKQCRKIQSRFVQNMASALGFNRNFPTTLLHAPTYLGGANIPDLYREQGICQVKFLLRHIRGQTRMGSLLRTVLDWAQTYSGISKNIMEDVRIPIEKYVPVKWLHSIRQFLREADFHLNLCNASCIEPRRENDRCIMNIANEHFQCPADLQDINNCRMYLQVENMSDIATACGKFLQPNAIAKQPPSGEIQNFFSSISIKTFPRQQRPGKWAWTKWLALMKICTGEYKNTLETTLGKWFNIGARGRLWNSYCRPEENDLITKHTKGKWESIPLHSLKRTARIYDTSSATNFIEDTRLQPQQVWIPIDIIDSNEDWVITNQVCQEYSENDNTQDTCALDEANFLIAIDAVQKQRISEVIATVKYVEITGLPSKNGNSDSYCSLIICPTIGGAFTNEGTTHGIPTNPNRNELFGIAAALTILNHVAENTDTTITTLHSARIYVHSHKNYRALREWPYHRTETSTTNWDILEYIYQKQIETTIHTPVLNLPPRRIRDPSLYLLYSTIEKQQSAETRPSYSQTINARPFRTTSISLCNHKTYICAGAEEHELRRCINEYDYTKYLKDNKNMSLDTIYKIAWSERHVVMKTLSNNVTTFIGKLTHGWLPTAQRQHHIGEIIKPICQRCGLVDETPEHIYKCKMANAWKIEATTKIRTLLSRKEPRNEQDDQGTHFRLNIAESFTLWLEIETNAEEEKMEIDFSHTSDTNTNFFHCICGMIPSSWSANNKLSKNEMIRMIRCFIDIAQSGWLLRCQQIHNKQDKTNNEMETEYSRENMIKNRARQLHDRGQNLNINDRQYFDFDIEQFIVGRHYQDILDWCTHTNKYIRDSQKREKQRNKKRGPSQQDIRQYLLDTNDKYPP